MSKEIDCGDFWVGGQRVTVVAQSTGAGYGFYAHECRMVRLPDGRVVDMGGTTLIASGYEDLYDASVAGRAYVDAKNYN